MNRAIVGYSKVEIRTKVTMKLVLVWLSLATIFMSGLYTPTPIGIMFWSYILMSMTFILMAVINRSIGLKNVWLIFFVILQACSLVSIMLTYSNYGDLLERFISSTAKVFLLFIFVIFYYLIYRTSNHSVVELFYRYFQVAVFFSWLGVLQELIFILSGMDIFGLIGGGAKNHGAYLGIAGLSVEPAFYACALLPAAAYSISEFVRSFKITINSFVLILSVILSTSSLGYLGLFAAAALSFFIGMNKKKLWMVLLSLPLVLIMVYKLTSTDFFQLRWHDTVSVLQGGELTMEDGMNISTYSAAVNAIIAISSVKDNYGGGAGFGTYSTVFDKYINQYEMPTYRDTLPGRGSATSLFSRATAEMGVVAWLFFVLVGSWCWRILRRSTCKPIAIAYVSTLLIILMRMGEYYANGVILVFLMIYWMKKEYEFHPNDKPKI
ncbi:hypothetical protein [Pectobacterium sp. CFBP8739]|uniref:hypothetical protein n=1 Tax=Pectobacterium sp. CFBP8739 TaxID=2748908 RepID=UPI0015DF19BE|nr:hypothetical protein [Pectobacterium sp. CFBP8739]MBA0167779.1 hypothetical protein [Pectobacterium sp. CFBP8739]